MPTNKKIVIVGAGLGGLSAAICFAREGNSTIILERQPGLSPRGGPILIRPNASRILISWDLREALETVVDINASIEARRWDTGKVVGHNAPDDFSTYPEWTSVRNKVQDILAKKAADAGVDMRYQTQVDDFVEHESGIIVTLHDGKTLNADLLIAADGVRSRLRPKILADLGVHPEPNIISTTSHPIKISWAEAQKSADLVELFRDNNSQLAFVGKPGCYVIMRKFEKLDLVSGYVLVAEGSDMNGKALWDENGDIEKLREELSGCAPALRAFLDIASHADRWKLSELPDLPRWNSEGGRCVLLGDAAHGMLPSAAQGFSTIVEDVATLATMVSGCDPEQLPERTNQWQQLRIPRVSRIKAHSAHNHSMATARTPQAERELKKYAGVEKGAATIVADMNADFNTPPYMKWEFGYDAVAEARRALTA